MSVILLALGAVALAALVTYLAVGLWLRREVGRMMDWDNDRRRRVFCDGRRRVVVDNCNEATRQCYLEMGWTEYL